VLNFDRNPSTRVFEISNYSIALKKCFVSPQLKQDSIEESTFQSVINQWLDP